MAADLTKLIGDSIASDLTRINGLSDQELLTQISQWLDATTGEGLYAATPLDRFQDWLQTTILPHLRKLGESGQDAWNMICDPASTMSKDRIASIVLAIAVLSGLQQLDVSTLVAIVVLAIRVKHRQP